ncbi:MAG: hypothetical protein EOO44_06240 [Flavobacterium sp.]|nr:MAG: hypothetical protein EOO44_06240 [Flavobacterium sp.]
MKKLIGLFFAFAILACNTKDEQKIAEGLVKKNLDSTLKDPKSYEVIEFGKVMTLKDTIIIYEGKPDTVRYNGVKSIFHKYRAKNSFGGYVVSSTYFHIDSNMTKAEGGYRK